MPVLREGRAPSRIIAGLMSSIAPYVADLLALRRVPAQMFGTFTSINPVWAALSGWLLLRQALDLGSAASIAAVAPATSVAVVRLRW